jgi:hypothetical protein
MSTHPGGGPGQARSRRHHRPPGPSRQAHRKGSVMAYVACFCRCPGYNRPEHPVPIMNGAGPDGHMRGPARDESKPAPCRHRDRRLGRSGAASRRWAPWRGQDVSMSARYQVRLISASRAQAQARPRHEDRMLRLPRPVCGRNAIGKVICLRLVVVGDRLFSGETGEINPVPAVQPSAARSRRRLVTWRARTTFPFDSNNGCAAARWSRSPGVLPSIFSTSAAAR